MKVAPLHRAFTQYPDLIHQIIHTGQHYYNNMSKVFFEELNLPEPDMDLGVGSGSHGEQTGKIMIEFEKVLVADPADLVIVVGDVNSTLACALVAAKLGIHVAHVEAGLRSFDRSMPEELNRVLTDALSDFLFVTEPSGVTNLLHEGVAKEKIFLVGNVMIDTLIECREKARSSNILQVLDLQPKGFAVVTLHRPLNVDRRENLELILDAVEQISVRCKVVFPVHPRTKKMLTTFKLEERASRIPNSIWLDPLSYFDFLHLLENAALVLTDSGGVQQETTFLGVPCLTLREETEHLVTLEEGTNELVGLDEEKIVRKSFEVLDGKGKAGRIPALWDGKAAERIVNILMNHLH